MIDDGPVLPRYRSSDNVMRLTKGANICNVIDEHCSTLMVLNVNCVRRSASNNQCDAIDGDDGNSNGMHAIAAAAAKVPLLLVSSSRPYASEMK